MSTKSIGMNGYILDVFATIDLTNHSHHQIGKIGEYWAKLIMTLYGFDIYTSEVDEKGVDFVIRISENRYIDVQVKSARVDRTKYVFVSKKGVWKELRDNLYMAFVYIDPKKLPPKLYLIPSTAWRKENSLLNNRDYQKEGQKSHPEWGLTISTKNMPLLEDFSIEKQVRDLLSSK